MSVYSYIEILDANGGRVNDEELYLGFGHGINWAYQIGVAGGKRFYEGVKRGGRPETEQFEDATATSIYQQNLASSLVNYHRAVNACLMAFKIDGPENARWLQDLALLFKAQAWYKKAFQKVPNGFAKLDWSEGVWGMSEAFLAEWDTPNDNLTFFIKLTEDCLAVRQGELSRSKFVKKYSESACGTDKGIKE